MYEVMPPLFLSHDAHDMALRIFEAVKDEDKPAVENAVSMARLHLAKHSWSEYDGTYLALYTLSLVNRGKPDRLDGLPYSEGLSDDGPRRDFLFFVLDLSLVGEGNRYRLLDERGVAQVINFRQALEGFFPFEIHPRAVGVNVFPTKLGVRTWGGIPHDRLDALPWDDAPHGRVAMVFDVRLPRLPAWDLEKGGSARTFLSSFFSGKEWKAVSTRFNVANVEVDGRTQSL